MTRKSGFNNRGRKSKQEIEKQTAPYEAAHVVASALNGDVRRLAVGIDAEGRYLGIGLLERQLHVHGRIAARQRPIEQLGQRAIRVRTADHVDYFLLGDYFVLETLGHAAEDAHLHVVSTSLQKPQLLQPIPDLLLGILANAARDQQDHVGLSLAPCSFVGVRLVEYRVGDLGVVRVHLTAEHFEEDLSPPPFECIARLLVIFALIRVTQKLISSSVVVVWGADCLIGVVRVADDKILEAWTAFELLLAQLKDIRRR